MDTELTEEQRELIGAVRALLERRGGSLAVRAAFDAPRGDERLWQGLAEEIGVAAISVPEEYDGFGATSFESHLVLEAIGEALAPVPAFGSAAIAVPALLATGDGEAASRILPRLASGEQTAALAWADPTGSWNPEGIAIDATPAGAAWTLSGTAPLVIDGVGADVLLVLAKTPTGVGVFEVADAATATLQATPALDPTLRLASLTLDGVAARALSVGDTTVLDRIRDTALVAITALQVGATARGLAMTVEYAGQRVQFGRALGSFQALKHRMADMHAALETARSISRAAARALADGDPETPVLAAMAKSWCGESLDRIAAETIQLHGGIGITWEHDAHLVFKRAHALGQLFGQPSAQRRRLASMLDVA